MSVRSLIVGIDLNKEQPLISYYERELGKTVTAPLKIGNEKVSFRTILEKIEAGVSDTEKEALFDETADLFRQAFVTLGITDLERQIGAIMTTVPKLTKNVVELMKHVYATIGVNPNRSYLQDYKESFCFFTLYLERERWNRDVGLFRFEDNKVTYYMLKLNHRTRPVTISVEQGKSLHLVGEQSTWDHQFYGLIKDSIQGQMLSCILLTGDGFDRSWAAKSTSLLCGGGRRVYIEENIFAIGAANAARERAADKKLAGYQYLGDELVRYHVGMELYVDGKMTLYPMIAAGVNWYEAAYSFECMLNGEREVTFMISTMDQSRTIPLKIELDGLPDRPPKTTRLQVSLSFMSPKELVIEIEDLGFGDMFPSSGNVWRRIMEDRD